MEKFESNKKMKENGAYSKVREKGRNEWYRSFKTRIAKVERDYDLKNNNEAIY